jgi:cytochrome b561
MQLKNTSERYGAVAIGLHWITVLLVAVAWGLGQAMDLLPKDSRPSGIAVHIAVGLIIFVAVLGRFAWRMGDPPPDAIRSPLGYWTDVMAIATHYGLYLLLAAAPILGVATWFARGQDLSVLGLFHIVTPLAQNRDLAHSLVEVHETLANAIVILAGLHASAALVHHYIFKDQTLLRMLPRRG